MSSMVFLFSYISALSRMTDERYPYNMIFIQMGGGLTFRSSTRELLGATVIIIRYRPIGILNQDDLAISIVA